MPRFDPFATTNYGTLARDAGWLCKGGIWFNERFDGPEAATAQDGELYEDAKQLCEGECLINDWLSFLAGYGSPR